LTGVLKLALISVTFGLTLLPAQVALQQLDTTTVIVGASRPLSSTPDQVVVNLTLVTAPGTGLDEAVAALQDVGVTAADLTGLSSAPRYDSSPTGVTYLPVFSFSMTVPLSSINSKMIDLFNLSNQLLAKQNGWTLSYDASNLQSSAPPECSVAGLFADAQSHATDLANAIGYALGPVLAVGDEQEFSRIFSQSAGTTFATFGAYVVGAFQQVSTFYSKDVNPQPNCSIVVKFQLVPGA
jgi:uncharacterized protein YggE